MSVGSKMELMLAKAKTISDGGSTLAITYLSGKKCMHQLEERIWDKQLQTARVGLVDKVEIGGRHGHSDHEATDFKISVDRRKSASKTSNLVMRRADFRLIRVLKKLWEPPHSHGPAIQLLVAVQETSLLLPQSEGKEAPTTGHVVNYVFFYMKKWDGDPTSELEAQVRELRGKRARKKAFHTVAAETPERNQRPLRCKKTNSFDPGEGTSGLASQMSVNTLTRNRNRGALPLTKRRNGMTGLLDCVDSMAWHIGSADISSFSRYGCTVHIDAIEAQKRRAHLDLRSDRRMPGIISGRG
ncbi:hypothetical protein BTVI_08789 [Pitangus sulphuratus]|nr:hypothetical protein BTVI_08789 [Pitangus sulphuratus]